MPHLLGLQGKEGPTGGFPCLLRGGMTLWGGRTEWTPQGPGQEEGLGHVKARTLMYWNSSTGDSGRGGDSRTPGPAPGLCLRVMSRSLLRMATTIRSSRPWWVLMAYRWQPGEGRDGMSPWRKWG